jgi:hypothetical protein
MNTKREKDYGHEYPIKAFRYNWEINVRKMRKDEMPDDGINYYCEENGTIYIEGEKNFRLAVK